jgi:hypothetical protein
LKILDVFVLAQAFFRERERGRRAKGKYQEGTWCAVPEKYIGYRLRGQGKRARPKRLFDFVSFIL